MNQTNKTDLTGDDTLLFPAQFCLILDLRNWDEESENTSDCLVYHYPDDESVRSEVCKQLLGCFLVNQSFTSSSKLLLYSRKSKIRILKHKDFVLFLGNHVKSLGMTIKCQMEFLLNTFQFFYCDFDVLLEACNGDRREFLARMKNIGDVLMELIFSANTEYLSCFGKFPCRIMPREIFNIAFEDNGKLSDKVKIVSVHMPVDELKDYLDKFDNTDESSNSRYRSRQSMVYSPSASIISNRFTSTPVHRRSLSFQHSSTLPDSFPQDFHEISYNSVEIDTSTTDTNSVDRTSCSDYRECDGSSEGSAAAIPMIASLDIGGNAPTHNYHFGKDTEDTGEESTEETQITLLSQVSENMRTEIECEPEMQLHKPSISTQGSINCTEDTDDHTIKFDDTGPAMESNSSPQSLENNNEISSPQSIIKSSSLSNLRWLNNGKDQSHLYEDLKESKRVCLYFQCHSETSLALLLHPDREYDLKRYNSMASSLKYSFMTHSRRYFSTKDNLEDLNQSQRADCINLIAHMESVLNGSQDISNVTLRNHRGTAHMHRLGKRETFLQVPKGVNSAKAQNLASRYFDDGYKDIVAATARYQMSPVL
ncbi:uncharacterized protein TRIADDRAFT_51571 [Trichoplax adhaerens]|uniref:CCZ1/INTU/HSP4 first Longin domain-containing protein n=1 Tax=Trichoplax adhaerens TaxID=10228 RepID=B3RJZ7_TRIAD|nr:predicted protein [Trichoplax adhaerens]EDV28549.1 predicted protein [Trichoplax adhaerens]|eukprot:XP_002107751.1 predicted protein [Trichoplax adhaerens]